MKLMSFFEKKQIAHPNFKCGVDVYAWALKFYTDKGEDPLIAASKAEELKDKICKGLDLPNKLEPEKKGIELVDQYCEQYTGKGVKSWAQDLAPYILGAVTTGLGTIVGAKIEQDAVNNNEFKESIYDNKNVEHGESV